MSRKIKYDVDFKLKVIQQILKGKESADSISFNYTIDDFLASELPFLHINSYFVAPLGF